MSCSFTNIFVFQFYQHSHIICCQFRVGQLRNAKSPIFVPFLKGFHGTVFKDYWNYFYHNCSLLKRSTFCRAYFKCKFISLLRWWWLWYFRTASKGFSWNLFGYTCESKMKKKKIENPKCPLRALDVFMRFYVFLCIF